jgi:hypothetical protein
VDREPALVTVLGVDLASGCWVDNGTSQITFDSVRSVFTEVIAPAIAWPENSAITPSRLAKSLDDYARANGIRAVGLDGPQGWRDPATAPECRGVGRRCEFESRTQSKTGVYPNTYPRTQRAWIEFCIEVFDALLSNDDVTLADPASRHPPSPGYTLVEACPTAAWISSGLKALPAKKQRPELKPFVEDLAREFNLPLAPSGIASHDDLQAVVAGLAAAAAVGGPVEPVLTGVAAGVVQDGPARRRIEGYIWNIRPQSYGRDPVSALRAAEVRIDRPHAPTRSSRSARAALRVTPDVIAQVRRSGDGQAQIALRGAPAGTAKSRVRWEFRVSGVSYALIIGDSHVAWRSHQDVTADDSFERLFRTLCSDPGKWQEVDG